MQMANSQNCNCEYDVIIIGGGATGAGTARDCAKRGLKVLLIERLDITAGATGRNHGLLHSGARYAVTDHESAEECIKENMILRKIASHCVEETGGYFITLPEDDLGYQSTFIQSCLKAGINAEEVDPKEALLMEPSINPSIIGAVKVPDGAIDPFRLTTANVIDAKLHGAEILTYHEVIDLILKNGDVSGVSVRNSLTGEKKDIQSRIVVNASGIWSHGIAQKAGIKINMFPAKGALLIFGHRVNNKVINRCRKPGDGDILVPGDTISLIGTTSSRIPYEDCDNMEVTAEEVNTLLREGCQLVPSLSTTRILRAYAGVRPLIADDSDPTGRKISRGIVCMDHKERDGVGGFITVSGGKLMTYRLMAEIATDMVCKKLNIDKKCQTHIDPLPGSEQQTNSSEEKKHIISLSIPQIAARERHGTLSKNIKLNDISDDTLVCECEQVTVGEIKYAINSLHVSNLINLRRRTRLGMGTCQGGICASRAAAIMANKYGSERALVDLKKFLQERWKGQEPVAWGRSLAESYFTSWIYKGVCGMTNNNSNQ